MSAYHVGKERETEIRRRASLTGNRTVTKKRSEDKMRKSD